VITVKRRSAPGFLRQVVGVVATCGSLLLQAASSNGEVEVPVDRQVLILSRALAYDSELKARVGSDILIAVLSKPGHPASEAMGQTVLKAYRQILNVKVQGIPLAVRPLSYAGPAALAAAVAAQSFDVVYVCTGLDPDLPAIIEVARKRRVVTIASNEEQVTRGLALGVFAIDARPTIVLNLGAARSEGAAFSSELLRVAKVINQSASP
jgi:hypothetical protein